MPTTTSVMKYKIKKRTKVGQTTPETEQISSFGTSHKKRKK
jgi:hypothetical protein